MTEPRRWTRQQAIRHAVMRVVSDGSREGIAPLARVREDEWRGLLRWLDVSGLALYFFDRLREMGQNTLLPLDVWRRLEGNLADNTVRTQAMIAEAAAIRDAFDEAGLSFALLKGISLTPDSVARPELRSQLDIDFLVKPGEIEAARRILEDRGYYLHAVTARSWEFKTYAIPSGSLMNLYRNVPWRCVELHEELEGAGSGLRLARRERRVVGGVEMPVLCAADIFLGQGLHLFKHVSSAHYRAAHLIEYHRHVAARRGDERFWGEVEERARETEAAAWALGVVTLLDELMLGKCAPESFARWTVNRLSGPVRLWVERYAWRAALTSIPGNKLYLLLARQLEEEGYETRWPVRGAGPARNEELTSARGPLVPRQLPRMVVRGQAGESLGTRLSRYRLQVWFLMLRLRFHVVEGVRFMWESWQWKRSLRNLKRSGFKDYLRGEQRNDNSLTEA